MHVCACMEVVVTCSGHDVLCSTHERLLVFFICLDHSSISLGLGLN